MPFVWFRRCSAPTEAHPWAALRRFPGIDGCGSSHQDNGLGIAMGLITGEDGRYAILSDIQGMEDFLGDMDFKVAGTAGD